MSEYPGYYSALSFQGIAVAESRVWSMPRFRVWLGIVATELLFDQADRFGLVTSQWC